ncbi:hypothetical protein C8T65DRAFT_571390 [Cerioporus squamosus]|nr:hypothetical protein C8T65DRAFT_571390 [Cerioporus squamosus]
MAAVPTKIDTWSSETVEAAGAEPMALHLAIQALVQNQVDQILKEMHLRQWSEWTHEDLRGQRPFAVKLKKQLLLENFPGLLAGPHAIALRHEHWSPYYLLSADIPVGRLRETPHKTSLRILNVLWQHQHSRAFSLTFYNNHLDASASIANFLTESLSTNRHSQWAVGTSGRGFLRACHYLLGSHQRRQGPACRLAVALRVGDVTGEFMYRNSGTGKEEFALRRQDLTPLSFQRVDNDEGFLFPFDHHLPRRTPLPSKKTRVSAIYNMRFLQGLSERLSDTQVAMEPTHERPFVMPDEVVVTIYGLRSDSLSPEYLFSGIYGIFPPPQTSTWTVPARGRASADITFFLPSLNSTFLENSRARNVAERCGRFYYRDYLIPAGPSTHRLCINYGGDLHLSTRNMEVQMNYDCYTMYRRSLMTALDTAMRTIPELAVEIAYDILTEPDDVPDTFSSLLALVPEAQDDDTKQAYRAAFSKAWCRLDPALATRSVYPSAAGVETTSCEKALIEQLGLHPIFVRAHMKVLLERVGAYPPIGVYADHLLRSAPGAVNIPAGIDVLKRCLTTLFPNLPGGPLSVRQYSYSFPRAVWDEEAQIFVVASAACQCEVRGSSSSGLLCKCWIAPVLQEAVLNWHAKNAGRSSRSVSADDHAATPWELAQPLGKELAEKRLFHVLYQNCKSLTTAPDVPHEEAHLEADDGADLEYADASPVAAEAGSGCDHPSQPAATPANQ